MFAMLAQSLVLRLVGIPSTGKGEGKGSANGKSEDDKGSNKVKGKSKDDRDSNMDKVSV
jgi:hypothetical protein